MTLFDIMMQPEPIANFSRAKKQAFLKFQNLLLNPLA